MKQRNLTRTLLSLLLVLVLALSFAAVPAAAADKDNLSDGEYTIYATMQKAGQPQSYSMANNAIDHNVKLTVATVNGQKNYTLTVDFNGMAIKLGSTTFFGYLKNLSYYDQGYTYNNYGMPTGERKSVTVVSYQKDANGAKISDDFGTDYPDLMSFPLVPQAISDDYVPLHVFVPIMESISAGSGDQDVLMKLDWSTLKKVEQNPFVDVAQGQYFYEPVLWAVSHNPQITNGKNATHFDPNATCTRAQAVTFLWRAKGCPEPTNAKNPFSDVSKSAYYYKAVLWAVSNGITTGTTATTFNPNGPCTRAHVVTFLWRAEGKPAASGTNPFKDVAAGQYYANAVLWAVNKGITTGVSATTFCPDNLCTRAQIVTFLYRDMA